MSRRIILTGDDLAAALGDGWTATGNDAVRGALTVRPGDHLYFATLGGTGITVRGSDPVWCAKTVLDTAEERAWHMLAVVYRERVEPRGK